MDHGARVATASTSCAARISRPRDAPLPSATIPGADTPAHAGRLPARRGDALLGRPFGAEAALAAGRVNEVVPESRLLDHAREAALPRESVRITKELLKRPHAQAVKERMAEEIRILGERLSSPEAKAALGAFFQKKKPSSTPNSG